MNEINLNNADLLNKTEISPTKKIFRALTLIFLVLFFFSMVMFVICLIRAFTLKEIVVGGEIAFEQKYDIRPQESRRYVNILAESLKFATVSTSPGVYDVEQLYRMQQFLIQNTDSDKYEEELGECEKYANIIIERVQLLENLIGKPTVNSLPNSTLSALVSTELKAPEAPIQKYMDNGFPLVFNNENVVYETVNNLSLLLQVKGSEKSLEPYLLSAHLDVVPVEPSEWAFPPFSGLVTPDPESGEEVIWGRGAIDVKSKVVGVLSALEILFKNSWTPKRSFYVAFGHDEEVSGFDGAGRIGDLLLSRNATLDFLLDEGMPFTKGVIKGFEHPIALVGVTEKGRMDVRVTAQGTGGHSSLPPKDQAVKKLVEALSNLNKYPQPSKFGYGPEKDMIDYLAPKASWPHRIVMGNTWLFGPLLAHVLSLKSESDALVRTTTAITILEAGIKVNVVPGSAHAVVNHRVHPSQSLEEVLNHDRWAIGDHSVKLEVSESMAPHPVSSYERGSPFDLIVSAIKHVFPDVVTAPGIMIANTDSRHYLKLTKNIYRLLPFVLNPAQIKKIHSKDENLSVKSFEKAIKFYTAVVIAAEDFKKSSSDQHTEF